MITKADALYLRRIAERMEGGSDPYTATLDAAGLRSVADALDDHLRPRSAREIEGDRRRAPTGLWPAFRRLWSRQA